MSQMAEKQVPVSLSRIKKRIKKNQNAQNINRKVHKVQQEIPRRFNEPGSSELPGEYWSQSSRAQMQRPEHPKCQFSRCKEGSMAKPAGGQQDPLRK